MKESHDMTFTVPETSYSFGQDVTLQVEMSNKARQHVVKGTILCEAVDYTGSVSGEAIPSGRWHYSLLCLPTAGLEGGG